MEVQPFVRSQEAQNYRDVSSVDRRGKRSRIALFVDQKLSRPHRRSSASRGRTPASRSAHGDKVRHRRYRGGRRKRRPQRLRCHVPAPVCRECDACSGRGRHRLANPQPRAHLQSTHESREPGMRRPGHRTAGLGTTIRRSSSADHGLNRGDQSTIPHDDASTGFNAARRVSHRYRHMGQKEHCVSVRSSVTKACGDPHRGQPTYRRVACFGNHTIDSV